MRVLVLACLGPCLLGCLAAAQPEPDKIPGDQCLGGTLVSVQPDSITLKFNEKIVTMRLAPDA